MARPWAKSAALLLGAPPCKDDKTLATLYVEANKNYSTNNMTWLALYVRHDSSLGYVEYSGYISTGELYPDFKPTTFRGFLAGVLAGKEKEVYSMWVMT
ncbi:isoflavone reductase family protein [Penicillium diatomitis]|uniref:Isoflavone reductase family protein n=1 Tax=Penicillium diatomitis TaxID=2819901 RepID=A0A9W9X767_9EURO|nr:isoflavone reductase family protein [Penicillium diatomitis]KAJ5485603.1 isoflavone reductase family protein [Penicillium diatomitis]